MKFINAKCPNCGANLSIQKNVDIIKCEYCHQSILIEDKKQSKSIELISINGIETNDELLSSANELLELKEYLKAKKKFLEYSEKFPNDYQGWLGLLICRTRNFTIKDNNIIFENDVNKYFEHFSRTAPKHIKEKYDNTINKYFGIKCNNQFEENESDDSSNNYHPFITPILLILTGLLFFEASIIASIFLLSLGIGILVSRIKN